MRILSLSIPLEMIIILPTVRHAGIAVDPMGCAYVFGETDSIEESFPLKVGPDLTHNGGTDIFVVKDEAPGTDLAYCGYIGGIENDRAEDIAIDESDLH